VQLRLVLDKYRMRNVRSSPISVQDVRQSSYRGNHSNFFLIATSIAEQPDDERESVSTRILSSPICTLHHVTITDKNPAIGFTRDLNDTLRDQYGTDGTCAATGQKTGCLISIQGDKTGLEGNDRHRSVLPMLKVSSYCKLG
jgi:hypothetical protein